MAKRSKINPSKHFVAGEPISDFIRRGVGATGCWVCNSYKDALVTQRNVGSAVARSGNPLLRVKYLSMDSIRKEANTVPSVMTTVVCHLYETTDIG